MLRNYKTIGLEIASCTGIAIQHLLIAIPAIVAVPVLFGAIVGLNHEEMVRMTQMTILLSGLMTLLHSANHKWFGSHAPMVFGADVAVIAVGIRAASQLNLRAFFLILCLGAVLSLLISKLWIRKSRLLSPPVVMASMLIYSLTMMPTALDWFLGGVGAPDYGSVRNVLVGSSVLAFTLFLSQYGKGVLKYGAIGLGMLLGVTISLPLGLVKWSEYNEKWFSLPELMPYTPSFSQEALIIVVPIVIVLLVKQYLDLTFFGIQAGFETEEELKLYQKGSRTNAVGFGLSFLLGALPTSALSLNLGIQSFLQKNCNRSVVMTGVVLVLLGLMPRVSAKLLFIPLPVLGAMGFLLIASLFNLTVIYSKHMRWTVKSTWVLTLSFLFGLMTLVMPETGIAFSKGGRILLESGICVTFFSGLILEFVMPEN